jgi:hypothetical protein
MDGQIAVGFVFGRLWANRAGVRSSSLQNQAGLMMALGGMTPMGVALASAMIRRSSQNARGAGVAPPDPAPAPEIEIARNIAQGVAGLANQVGELNRTVGDVANVGRDLVAAIPKT